MRKKNILRLGIVLVLILVSSFNYLPYYVSKPGMARELAPIVEVGDGNGKNEKGTFMLTTISLSKANIYTYALAKLSKYQELYPLEEIRAKDESEDEYNARQLHMMDGSKTTAIEVAYKKAGLPVKYRFNGVYVMQIIQGMGAEKQLKPGDHLIAVDGKKFGSTDEFKELINQKKSGDKVEITYVRNEATKKAMIEIQPFANDKNKVGIGVTLVEDKEVMTDPKVTINTDEIGGPSAGLMFTLEIYNQLTKQDLTKGYRIAGTGTISPDGTVGSIGGIDFKVVAAHKAGAHIFFAPNEKGAKNSNYQIAVKTAKDIGTDMKIVPVDTFDEAVAYLEKLKPYKQN
jgi:PDZ domain-containing protein